jgi:hypothetical protein
MKKTYARLLVLVLSVAMLAGVTACGGSSDKSSKKSSKTSSEKSDSERIKLGTNEKMEGTTKLKSEQIMIEPALTTKDTFNAVLRVHGSTAYILSDGKVRQYKYADDKLTYVKEIKLDNEYKHMDMMDDGTIALSGLAVPCVGIRDGEQICEYDDLKYVALHPSGEWGINYFTDGGAAEKIVFKGSSVKRTSLPLRGVDSIRSVDIDNHYIYVCGTLKNSDEHPVYIFIYNHKGRLLRKLKDSDGGSLGSVSYTAKIKSGYMALDANMRTVNFWNNKGRYVMDVAADDVFGTDYPWLASGQLMSDGSLLTLMTQRREDGETKEVLVCRLTGFK